MDGLLIGVLQTINARSEEYQQRMQTSKVKRAMARVAMQCVSREETLRGLIHQIIEQQIDGADERVAMRARCEGLMKSFFEDLARREGVLGQLDSRATLVFQREWVENQIADIEAQEEHHAMVFQMDDLDDAVTAEENPRPK